jgi:hypothetical protein
LPPPLSPTTPQARRQTEREREREVLLFGVRQKEAEAGSSTLLERKREGDSREEKRVSEPAFVRRRSFVINTTKRKEGGKEKKRKEKKGKKGVKAAT